MAPGLIMIYRGRTGFRLFAYRWDHLDVTPSKTTSRSTLLLAVCEIHSLTLGESIELGWPCIWITKITLWSIYCLEDSDRETLLAGSWDSFIGKHAYIRVTGPCISQPGHSEHAHPSVGYLPKADSDTALLYRSSSRITWLYAQEIWVLSKHIQNPSTFY